MLIYRWLINMICEQFMFRRNIKPYLTKVATTKSREYYVAQRYNLKDHVFQFRKWTRRDLNPRPPACKAGALPLSYGPKITYS